MVREELNCDKVRVEEVDFHQVYVTIRINNISFVVSSIYFLPGLEISNYIDYLTQIESLMDIYENYHIMVCGDFNLPKIDWSIEINLSKI